MAVTIASVPIWTSANHSLHHIQNRTLVTNKSYYTGNGAHTASLPFHKSAYAKIDILCIIFYLAVILRSVMIMKDSQKILNSLLSSVQMGQVGIRSVMEKAVRVDLKKALKSQLREYDSYETQAFNIAAARGWELKEVDPAVRKMADMMSRARLAFGAQDSKIAAMMIQGNTRGMIINLKDLHQSQNVDKQVLDLSQRLLDTEEANIKQMQGYL